jgi:pyruvate/2-oxoacid:ferredoxin oxidoreductase alpha subunit
MKQTTVITAIDAALQAAGNFVAETEAVNLADLLRRRGPVVTRPAVIAARSGVGEPVDICAMRWMHPGGHAPLVFAPADFGQALDLGAAAGVMARQLNTAVYVLLDHELAETEDSWRAYTEFRAEADPQLFTMDADPAGNRAEWLVLSFGSTVWPAADATRQARAAGLRVHHLALQTLWPTPEAAIMKAAAGVKHVVVAERNRGQYVHEIRRVLPMATVIPAGSSGAPVEPEAILERLQGTPRCC